MKRPLFLLLVFLLLSGTLLYLGWIQRSVSPDSWALGFSKSRGWEERMFEPGRFDFRWERIFPGAYSVHQFPIRQYAISFSIKGELPSGSTYAEVLDGKPSFSYEIELELQVGFQKERFPQLVRTEGLTSTNLEGWFEQKKNEIRGELTSRILQVGMPRIFESSSTGNTVPHAWHEIIRETILQGWQERFSAFSLLSLAFPKVTIPDMDLYRKGKSLYLSMEQAKQDTLISESKKRLIEEMTEQRRIESLKKYGELLKTYPMLLPYLAIERMQRIGPSELQLLQELQNRVPKEQ
ncbi:MAG: hypothetical protein N2442_04160 [Spirochaetes bacterium]|nr:hypothetical protein [Spirochaetota bacterium]